MKALLFSQQFYLLKNKVIYLGHQNTTPATRPVVFAFTKSKYAEAVRQTLQLNECRVEQYADCIYKVKTVSPADACKKSNTDMEIECHGYFDTQIHLSINNVDMFIVSSIIEADDASVYVVQTTKEVKPIFINPDMQRMHLNKLFNLVDGETIPKLD